MQACFLRLFLREEGGGNEQRGKGRALGEDVWSD